MWVCVSISVCIDKFCFCKNICYVVQVARGHVRAFKHKMHIHIYGILASLWNCFDSIKCSLLFSYNFSSLLHVPVRKSERSANCTSALHALQFSIHFLLSDIFYFLNKEFLILSKFFPANHKLWRFVKAFLNIIIFWRKTNEWIM